MNKRWAKNCATNFKIRWYAFFNIWKINKQKNWAMCFQICKYAFLTFEKRMSKKIVSGILRFVSMLHFNISKSDEQKIALGILRFVSMLSLIFEKVMSKKIVPGIFRFVSMLFQCDYFLVWMGVIGIFGICMYAFFNIWKRDEQKNCARYFQIRKYVFLVFEKAMSKKLCQVFSDL